MEPRRWCTLWPNKKRQNGRLLVPGFVCDLLPELLKQLSSRTVGPSKTVMSLKNMLVLQSKDETGKWSSFPIKTRIWGQIRGVYMGNEGTKSPESPARGTKDFNLSISSMMSFKG